MELEGKKGLLVTGQSRRTCTMATISLRLAVLSGFRGSFHLFVHLKWSMITFRKTRFRPIFDPFLDPKRPIFKACWDFPWSKPRHHGLKME